MVEKEKWLNDILSSKIVGKKYTNEQLEIEKERGQQSKTVENFFENIEKYEAKKSPEEIEIIELINEETNKLLEDYGLESVDFPSDRVLVFTPENFEKLGPPFEELYKEKKEKKLQAFYKLGQKIIFLFREKKSQFSSPQSKIGFIHNILHEMIHVKSCQALQFTKEESKLLPYRMGFEIYSRDGKKEYFKDINEAIVEELTKRIFNEKIIDSPILKNDKEIKELKEGRERIKKDKGREVAEEVFYFHTLENKNAPPGKKWTYEGIDFSYPQERKKLLELINELYDKNKDQFKDKEEIFQLFVQGALAGRLLPIARLIEKTFGEGSFRKLGEEIE